MDVETTRFGVVGVDDTRLITFPAGLLGFTAYKTYALLQPDSNGAFLWLLLGSPFTLRRFRRVRRGLCPKCAYRMGEAAVCTECGAELPPRVAPRSLGV